MIETQVMIIGGGPAGSACAWRLKQHNIDCIIIDQAEFPRLKPCGGWITPRVLRDLDMQPSEYPYGFTTFTTMRIFNNDFQLRLSTRQHAIRRIEFDHWLLQRSEAPFYQHAFKTIRAENDSYIIDDRFCGKYLIGAGGTYCPVYRNLFKPENPKARQALIAAQEEEFPWEQTSTDCWLWFWKGLPGYAWYVPKSNGYINVGVGVWAEMDKAIGGSLKSHWEHLLDQLERRNLVRGHSYQPVAHSYYVRQHLPAIRKGNAFLTGDSAGLATSDMAEGIGPAIRSGLLAADAIASGKPYSLDGIGAYTQGPLFGRIVKAIYKANMK